MHRMTEDEEKILAYLNKMLASMNKRIKAGNVTPDEYEKLRATASAIYRFAEETKKLSPKEKTKIETFPLLQNFKTQTDSAPNHRHLSTKSVLIFLIILLSRK